MDAARRERTDDASRDVVPVLLGLLRRIDERTEAMEDDLRSQATALEGLRRQVATLASAGPSERLTAEDLERAMGAVNVRIGALASAVEQIRTTFGPGLGGRVSDAVGTAAGVFATQLGAAEGRLTAALAAVAAGKPVAASGAVVADAVATGNPGRAGRTVVLDGVDLGPVLEAIAQSHDQLNSLRADLGPIENGMRALVEHAETTSGAGAPPSGSRTTRADGMDAGEQHDNVMAALGALVARMEQRDRAMATRLDRIVERLDQVETGIAPAAPRSRVGDDPAVPPWAGDLVEAIDATTAELERVGAALEALVGVPTGDGGAPTPGTLQRRQLALEAAVRAFGDRVADALDEVRGAVEARTAGAITAEREARIAALESKLERVTRRR